MNKLISALHNHASKKLSLKRMSFFLLSGVLVSLPFTFYAKTILNRLSVIMPEFAARVFSTAIFTPFLEEFAKAYPLLDRHVDSERSFLILGAMVGLGFGVTELLIYTLLLQSPLHIRIPGVLFHTASTSITAYGIAKNRPLWPYLCAVTLHLLINISAIFDLLWLISGYPILLATFSIAWYLHRKASPVKYVG